jgi:hypothetical protein
MTKLKCPELTCLRIYNVEDAKIIEFTLNLNQSKSIIQNKIRIILYWDASAVKDHIGVGGGGGGEILVGEEFVDHSENHRWKKS